MAKNCQEPDCESPATDQVSWPDVSRAEYPPVTEQNPHQGFRIQENGQIEYTATYPHKVTQDVCGPHADELMDWRAMHLNPERAALEDVAADQEVAASSKPDTAEQADVDTYQ